MERQRKDGGDAMHKDEEGKFIKEGAQARITETNPPKQIDYQKPTLHFLLADVEERGSF